MTSPTKLSRREREIMDLLYQLGEASAADVQTGLPDPPSYSAIRTTLRILEEKGHIRHEQRGVRYVFIPQVPRESAKKSALQHLMQTFFEDSAAQVVSALVENPGELSNEELDQIAAHIEKARKGGK